MKKTSNTVKCYCCGSNHYANSDKCPLKGKPSQIRAAHTALPEDSMSHIEKEDDEQAEDFQPEYAGDEYDVDKNHSSMHTSKDEYAEVTIIKSDYGSDNKEMNLFTAIDDTDIVSELTALTDYPGDDKHQEQRVRKITL